MWAWPAMLFLCLRLAASAPTISDQPEGNSLGEDNPLAAPGPAIFDITPALNDSSAGDVDDDALASLLNDLLSDYDAAENVSSSLSSIDSQSDTQSNGNSTSEDGASLEDRTASEQEPSSEAPTSSSATTAEPTPASEDQASAEETPSSSGNPSSSSSDTQDSSSSSADEYDYYDYPAYADYAAPTAFPFNMFDDLRPRPPVTGDVLPSSCAWAVVQCCDNPDKTVRDAQHVILCGT